LFIIFDLDDTLVDTTKTILPIKANRALEKMQMAGLRLPSTFTYQNLMKALTSASSSKLGLQAFLEDLNAMEFYQAGLEEIYGGDLQGISIQAAPKAIGVLQRLAKQHLLAIATVGEKQTQLEKLQSAGIPLHLFYRVEVIPRGDKKKFYQHVYETLEIPSKNIFVCGDKIPIDLATAKEFGFKTIHMRRGRGENFTEEIENVDYTICELSELIKIL
jgi:FMN phosphatase YigB (HAD superfamily)